MFTERKDYNKVITVKLVIPSRCNAKCPFCYNKDKQISCDKQQFLDNFINSLDDIICRIGDKNPISVDITGGEPTLDPELLAKVLIKLKQYDIKSRVLRTTITTNGTNLKEVIPFMKGVIDYVNISIHDWRPFRREDILGFCITGIQYKDMIKALNDIGITVSACAVIYRKIPNFAKSTDNFIDWAKEVGFISVRFRCDVFWEESDVFDTYLIDSKKDTEQFDVIDYENTSDSHWCRLRRKDKMRVFFLHGVLDTSLKTKGIVNPETGSSILIKDNGDTTTAASLLSQQKTLSNGKVVEESIESDTYTVRKNLIVDEITINKHKLNPDIYELSDMRKLFNNEEQAIGNLTFCTTVLVKAWEQNLKKWVLIRRPMRIPIFSPMLNLPDTPKNTDIKADIKSEITDFTERSDE